ncbi:MAG: PKD domain-containing protein, partial [Gemmatimonadales bacterium]|nr:PKD domain-containing protein [Gemmatimonadales bacterium]
MRARAWYRSLVLAGVAVACVDQPTEVVPEGDSRQMPGSIALATTSTEDGLSISTDKDDYAPGDTVWFTGAGWPAGDLLDVVLEDEPATHEPHRWTIDVLGDGTFRDSTYVVDVGDLGVKFTLNARSQATGRSLTVTFTDGNIRVNGTPVGAAFSVLAEQFGTSQAPSTVCSGNITDTGTLLVTASSGQGQNAGGINGNQSIRLTASPTSNSGGPFLGWRPPVGTTGGSGNTPYNQVGTAVAPATTSRTICVPGFSGGGNSGNYTANYTPKPDLKLTKTASAASFSVGTNASYTLKVENVGEIPTSGQVTVSDELPGGLTLVSASGSGWTCNAANPVSCERSSSLGPVPPNNAYPNILITFTPTAAAASITNTASVSGGGDASPGNNSSSVTNAVNGAVDLTIDKSHTGDFTRTMQEQYSLSVTNAGSAATTAPITVRDTLPQGLSLVSAGGSDWTCNAASPVVCTRSLPLGAGDPAPAIAVQVTVTPATADQITNRARVSGGGEAEADLSACTPTGNCDADPTKVVDGNNAPHADPGGPYDGAEGSPVQFDGTDSSDPNPGTTLSYEWDFGDGSPAGSGSTPSHTYADNGAYTVKLTVSDGSLTDVASTTATIVNVAPTASFNAPSPVNEGSAIALSLVNPDDASSVDQAAGFTYAFDCGDGAGYAAFSSTASRSCPTDDDGSRSVKAQVKDKDGDATEYTAQVTIENVPPTATFASPAEVDEGSPIGLSLAGADDVSSVDKAAGFTYAFDCGDGAGYAAFGSAASRSCPTNDNGSRTVKGQIKDKDGGISEYSKQVLVKNVPPTATFNAPSTVDEGSPFELSLTDADDASSVDEAAGFTFAFDCGDGAGYNSFGSAASRTCPTTDNGVRTAQGQIKDKDGGISTYTRLVTIQNVAPLVGPITVTPNVVQVGSSVTLTSPFSDVGTADTHTGLIEWDDGSTSPAGITEASGSGTASATHVYTTPNVYTVKLTITDDDGSSSFAIYEYVVVYDPSAGFVTGGGWINSPAGA